MANFDEAFHLVIEHEGGYVNDPDDKGGETKYGISQRSYPEINISSLTLEDAKAIYKNDYWAAMNLDLVLCQESANKIFDIGVNVGNRRAVQIAQDVLGRVCGTKMVQDGICGPQTLEFINSKVSDDCFLAEYKCALAEYYRQLNNPKYEKGWLRRAYS